MPNNLFRVGERRFGGAEKAGTRRYPPFFSCIKALDKAWAECYNKITAFNKIEILLKNSY